MSYEPTLVINYDDLSDALDTYLESGERRDEDLTRVVAYLSRLVKFNAVLDINGMNIVIGTPEFTSFNQLVRNQLDEWQIKYWTYN
jgi:hypothetical protein